MKTFKLSATISSDTPVKVREAIEAFVGSKGRVAPVEDGFKVEARVIGESAKDLNRTLLSSMRRFEKKTRLRAEWTSGGTTERFFDYVAKGTRKAE